MCVYRFCTCEHGTELRFRERANRLSRRRIPAEGGQARSDRGVPGASAFIYFSVLVTSTSIAVASTIMLALRSLLVIVACCVTAVMPGPVKAVYDQRQTGDLNVQIDLKNLQVIALLNSKLLDDYTDYDYFYDYADFTVKPGNRPTTSSATGTTEKNDITQVSEPLSSQNSTVSASIDNTSSATIDTTLSKGEGVPNADPSNGTASDTTLSKDEGIPNVDPSNGTASSTSNAENDDKSQPSEEEAGTGTAPSTADYDYFFDYFYFTKPGNRPTTSSATGTTEKSISRSRYRHKIQPFPQTDWFSFWLNSS